jgi:hypothetical protein
VGAGDGGLKALDDINSNKKIFYLLLSFFLIVANSIFIGINTFTN